MGQAKNRGTFEQRVNMATMRDAILRDMFAENDHTAAVVSNALRQIPMTPERLETLKARSKKVVPM